MLLYRLAIDARWAVRPTADQPLQRLSSDPWTTPVDDWELGEVITDGEVELGVPVVPSKIVGIGRNYVEHAAELGNEMPEEPLVFLKAPSALLPPEGTIRLPPESARVELEGEIALVIGKRLTRADRAECADGVLGVTAANDVTARDLQGRDKTFARGKSFDTFCPMGPAIAVGADLDRLEVSTRLDGRTVQQGTTKEMAWGPVDLVHYVARHMTLEPGDVVLTGTPAGVTRLEPGQTVEVEVTGVGTLRSRVEAL